MNHQLEKYLDLLGVTPGATLDEVNSAYMELISKFPENPTEEQEEHLQEIKRAYGIVRRVYIPPRAKGTISAGPRFLVPLGSAIILVLGSVLVFMNYGAIQMALTHYERGEVLKWSDQEKPYGTVIRYDPEHQFQVGDPAPAYLVRQVDSGEEIWLSDRLVEKGMTPIDGEALSTAGVGASPQ